MLEKMFKLKENNTTAKTEVIAGITTFMTMAYILAVNPNLLSQAGMDPTAVLIATCLASFIGTFAMALLANYPFALAPGMGLNAYFAFTVCGNMGYSWKVALMAVFFEGIIFIILSLTNVREAIFNAIPKNLKSAVSVGIGLFIALIAATLGNADMQRLKMTTRMGNAEWRATDDKGQLTELPLAIELKDFTIDEYPPKLMLIDNETGRALPEKSPVHVLLEEGVTNGSLQDWQLTIEQSIPMAASVATEDTLKFTEFHSMGATYAVYLKAVNQKNQTTKEGWVSCGSFLFPYKAIRLDSLTSLVMPEREPRRFASDVMVYTKDKQTKEARIEVNKPLSIAGWKIYQLSYDETKGKWSRMSVFELVRDPWLPIVYTGILMMIAGAIGLFLSAPVKKE